MYYKLRTLFRTVYINNLLYAICLCILWMSLLWFLIKYKTIDRVNISKSFDGSCNERNIGTYNNHTHKHVDMHTHTHAYTILSALSNNWSILMINELSEHNYPSNKRAVHCRVSYTFSHQSEEVWAYGFIICINKS